MSPVAQISLVICMTLAIVYVPNKLLRYYLQTLLIRTNSTIEEDRSGGLLPVIDVTGIYKGRDFELFYCFPSRVSSFSLRITLATGSKSNRKLSLLRLNNVERTNKQFVSTGLKKFDNRVATLSRPKYFAEEMLSVELQDRILSTVKFPYSSGEVLSVYPSGRMTVRQGFPWRYRQLENLFVLLHDMGDCLVRINGQYEDAMIDDEN